MSGVRRLMFPLVANGKLQYRKYVEPSQKTVNTVIPCIVGVVLCVIKILHAGSRVVIDLIEILFHES